MRPSPARGDPSALDPATEELKSLLVSATGNFRLSAENSPVLEKARNRLLHNGLSSLSAYLELLKKGEVGKRELDCLIAELTVGETFFFRQPDHFDALRDQVLPACLKRNENSRQLRIWSAGCANGAEPYSIAILVHAALGDRFKDWNVVIVGSDINRAFLAEAEAGSYSAWTLRGVPKEQVPGFFAKRDQYWLLREKYKQKVHFVYHNIINEEMPSIHKNIFAFDIVFCRNVMIYFDSAVNLRLAERINSVMVDDGWLFVGSTDFNPHLDATFASEKRSGAIVLRKRSADGRAALETAAAMVAGTEPPRPEADALGSSSGKTSVRRRAIVGTGSRLRTAARRAAPEPLLRQSSDIATIVELANRGDWQNASRHCEAILAGDPFNAAVHYYYALILQSTGAHGEAEQALRRAIYLDRGFALAHYQLGLARKDARDLSACAKAFRNTLDALSQTPDDQTISPCGQITALDLRELATQQLELLGEQ
ncbi:MAG: CheR family methyltransferase [Bauldia sp.]